MFVYSVKANTLKLVGIIGTALLLLIVMIFLIPDYAPKTTAAIAKKNSDIKYDKVKDNAGRIAFTTFHQSYGYEEFIEGIKPKLNDESETLGYSIEDGVFKEFCRRAKPINIQTSGRTKVKDHPRIWVMLLGGPGMTQLKEECFNKNEVRLGWNNYENV